MSLLKDDGPHTPTPGPELVFVEGIPATNSAAKFWPALVDEVAADYPACTRVELAAPSGAPLAFADLFPAWRLQRDLDRNPGADLRQALADTLAELALVGPPAPVTMRLLAGGEVLLDRALPADCLDAETFPFFAGWLFEWAGIRHTHWNDPRLEGVVHMEDRPRGRRYALSFDAAYTHVSEGLYRRTIGVVPGLAMLA